MSRDNKEEKNTDFNYKYPKSLWEFIGTPPRCAETEDLLQWKEIIDRYRNKWLTFLGSQQQQQNNKNDEEENSTTLTIIRKEQEDFLHNLVLDSHYYKLKASPEHTQKREEWTDSHRLEFVLYENMFISMDDMLQSEVRRKALHNCQELLRRLRLQNQQLTRKKQKLEKEERIRQQERLQREQERKRQEKEQARKLEEQRKAEAERKRKAAKEAAGRKRKAEEAAERKRKAEEAEQKRKAAEEEAERKRKAEEAEQKRKAEEAERKRKAAKEAAERKRKAEEAAERKRKAEEAEQKRKAAEEEAERKRKAEEAERKRKAEEAERKRKAAEEAAERKRKAEAERKRQEAEQRRREEEERKRQQEERRRQEEAEAEAEAKRLREEEQKRQDERRRQQEEEERERKRQRQQQEQIRQRAKPAIKKSTPLIIEILDSSDEESVVSQLSEKNSSKMEKQPPVAVAVKSAPSIAPDRLARVLGWLREKINIQTRRVTVAEQQQRRQYKPFFMPDKDNNFSFASSAPRSRARIIFDQTPLSSMEIESAMGRFQIWEPYWLTHQCFIIGKTCPVQKVDFMSSGEKPSRAFAASIAIPSHIRRLISYRHENKPQHKYDHGEHRLLLRALPLNPPGEKKSADKKRLRADYHLWPKGTFLQFQNPTKIEQRSHDRTEWNGMSKPLDVSQILLNQSSADTELKMHICTYDDEPYIICLSLCEFISPQKIFQTLTGPSVSGSTNNALESVLPKVPHLSHDDAMALAVHKAKANHFAIDDDDGDDKGHDLASIIFPLVDPSTCAVMKTPVRSRKCQHFQCFDLESFLLLNVNITGTRYECPICTKLINIWDLYICDLTDKMIQTKRSEITFSRNRIQLFSDCTWKLLPEDKLRYAR